MGSRAVGDGHAEPEHGDDAEDERHAHGDGDEERSGRRRGHADLRLEVNGATIVKTTAGSTSLTDTLDLSQAGNGDKGDVITRRGDAERRPLRRLDRERQRHRQEHAADDDAERRRTTSRRTRARRNTYSYSISDADGDTIASVATSCWAPARRSGADEHEHVGQLRLLVRGRPGSTTVSAQATDSGFGAGAGNTATQTVTVQNVAPTIAISGAANVNEGSVYTLTLGAVTDPGTDTVSSYVVHWGDGNSDTYASNGAKTHTYADGPSDHARSRSIWSTRTARSSTARTRSRCT